MYKALRAALAAFLLPVLLFLSMGLADAQVFKSTTNNNVMGGVLPYKSGGTNANTAAGALRNLLPSQSGQAGKYFQTNGTNPSWATIPGASLPSQTGNSGRILQTDGTNTSWVPAPSASCNGCVTVNVKDIPGVTADNNTDDDATAIDTYITAHPSNVIYHFPKGVFDVATTIFVDNTSNLRLEGEPGAILRKKAGMTDEYIVVFRYGQNITFTGLQFEGLTTSLTVNRFGEQGILCGSCDGFWVRFCRFLNIGDAAVRSTTNPSDTLDANSFNTYIDHNYFYNISQVTTTPAGSLSTPVGKSGTSNYHFDHNEVYNLKGSIKGCTRGVNSSIWITDNYIQNSTALVTSTGVELCSISNVTVANNYITGSQSWGINAYTNPEASLYKFDWFNYNIHDNTISNVVRGIRFSNGAYSGNGLSSDTRGISINNNTIEHVTGSGTVGITFVNGAFRGSSVSNNRMIDMTSGLYMIIPATGVLSTGNVQN